jgi:hypothetical protein
MISTDINALTLIVKFGNVELGFRVFTSSISRRNSQHSPLHSDDELVINIRWTNPLRKVWGTRYIVSSFFSSFIGFSRFKTNLNGQECFPFNLEPSTKFVSTSKKYFILTDKSGSCLDLNKALFHPPKKNFLQCKSKLTVIVICFQLYPNQSQLAPIYRHSRRTWASKQHPSLHSSRI